MPLVMYCICIKYALSRHHVRTRGRQHLALACFDFIRTRAALDLGGFNDLDIAGR